VWLNPDAYLEKYIGHTPKGLPNKGVFAPRNLALYTQSFNNPINIKDPDGNTGTPVDIAIGAAGGAVIGAIVGGGLEYASQVYSNYDSGMSFSDAATSNINTDAVLGKAADGATTGAVLGATKGMGLSIVIPANSAAGVAGGIADRAVTGKNITDEKSMITDLIAGGISAGIGEKIAETMGGKQISAAISKKITNSLFQTGIKKGSEIISRSSTETGIRTGIEKTEGASNESNN
jgi:hypothetical protein